MIPLDIVIHITDKGVDAAMGTSLSFSPLVRL